MPNEFYKHKLFKNSWLSGFAYVYVGRFGYVGTYKNVFKNVGNYKKVCIIKDELSVDKQ